ncbi:MAG: DUF342 domain-containing protein [bacterium]|nr:DUF342 domain-containing protein [bacterium]
MKGGVIGQDTAWIRSRGDVSCNHTLGARIDSCETLVVQKTAVNSLLFARVVSGPFKVLGGEVHAVEKIAIQEAGSPAGGYTVLAVATALPACEDDACENVHLAFQKDQEVPAPSLANEVADTRTHADLATARIEVAGTVHPGVVVRIGPFSTLIENAISGVQFRFVEESSPPIVVEPLAS